MHAEQSICNSKISPVCNYLHLSKKIVFFSNFKMKPNWKYYEMFCLFAIVSSFSSSGALKYTLPAIGIFRHVVVFSFTVIHDFIRLRYLLSSYQYQIISKANLKSDTEKVQSILLIFFHFYRGFGCLQCSCRVTHQPRCQIISLEITLNN